MGLASVSGRLATPSIVRSWGPTGLASAGEPASGGLPSIASPFPRSRRARTNSLRQRRRVGRRAWAHARAAEPASGFAGPASGLMLSIVDRLAHGPTGPASIGERASGSCAVLAPPRPPAASPAAPIGHCRGPRQAGVCLMLSIVSPIGLRASPAAPIGRRLMRHARAPEAVSGVADRASPPGGCVQAAIGRAFAGLRRPALPTRQPFITLFAGYKRRSCSIASR